MAPSPWPPFTFPIVTGVLATTLAGGIAAIILHGQQISGIEEATKVHTDADRMAGKALQDQIDRRFSELERIEQTHAAAIAALDIRADAQGGDIATVKARSDALFQELSDLRGQFGVGRAERMEADRSLQGRIDDLNLRLTELQRQVTALEAQTPPPSGSKRLTR